MRALFICKQNESYGFGSYSRKASGLYNSTQFIVQSLKQQGIHAEIIEVVDNNCIDREVNKFKPDLVVIEALWVVPPKFDVLQKLHPRVKWFVHLHSHMPFLALEGIAMEWIQQYADRNVGLIANSPESYEALRAILGPRELVYLPNVYLSNPHQPKFRHKEWMDIGCFGAVRPLKNHLLQALAALEFSHMKGKRLRFHINASRVETNGGPVLKNLRQLFVDHPDAELVEHTWHDPVDFVPMLAREIDLAMQVSLSETFNVVTADCITAGVPVVVSKEIKWASRFSRAKDDSLQDIIMAMRFAWHNKWLVRWNQHLLQVHSRNARAAWHDFVLRNRMLWIEYPAGKYQEKILFQEEK